MATSHPSITVISRAVDDDYHTLIDDVLNGTSTSSYAQSLKSDMASLSVSDGLVLLDSRRIVLPISGVKPVLQLLHASHSCINKTIVLARSLYYWPGMVNGIKQLISSCRECYKLLQSQPANQMTTAPPSRHFGYPMQHVGLDLFSFGGKSFLIWWITGVATPSITPCALSLKTPSSPSSPRGLIPWAGHRPFGATGAPSSVETSPGFVRRTASRTNSPPPATPRETV